MRTLFIAPANVPPEERAASTVYAVSVGTMSNGFELYGPFPDEDAAMTFAQSQPFDAWETVPLNTPEN